MEKMQFKRTIIIILAFSLCLIFVGCGKTKIDMKEYISVSFSKCNGYGQMEYTVDTEKLNSLVKEDDVVKFVKETSEWSDPLTEVLLIFDDVKFTDFLTILPEEDYSNLSNGDIVKFKVDVTDDLESSDYTLEDIEKELKVEFSSTEFTYEVSGLPEAEVIDLLSIVKDYVVFEGASGGAEAEVEITDTIEKEYGGYYFTNRGYNKNCFDVIKDNELVGDLSFRCVYQDYLSNGDIIPLVFYEDISFENLQSRLMDDGYVLLDAIDVTVSGLGECINEKEELKEDMIPKAMEYLESEIYAGSSNHVGIYWGNLKESAITNNYELDKGLLFIVRKSKIFDDYTAYGIRIIENSDGKYIFDRVGSDEFEDINNIDIDRYELEKIS